VTIASVSDQLANAERAVHFKPLLLNPRDSFTVKILMSGAQEEPRIDARIANISEVERLSVGTETMTAKFVRVLLFMVCLMIPLLLLVQQSILLGLVGMVFLVLLALVASAYFSIWLDKKMDPERLSEL
jgi:hypothetical protein